MISPLLQEALERKEGEIPTSQRSSWNAFVGILNAMTHYVPCPSVHSHEPGHVYFFWGIHGHKLSVHVERHEVVWMCYTDMDRIHGDFEDDPDCLRFTQLLQLICILFQHRKGLKESLS